MSRKKLYLLGPLAVAAAIALSACSPMSSGSTTQESTAPSTSEETMAPSDDAGMDPAANLVGTGCAAYAEAVPDGAGSVAIEPKIYSYVVGRIAR